MKWIGRGKRMIRGSGLILALIVFAVYALFAVIGGRDGLAEAESARHAGNRVDIPTPRWDAGTPVYRVTKVVDGDTIWLSNDEKVRLIGVDTPETVHPRKPVQYYGREASAFTKREIDGVEVRLTYGQERRDYYGRLLAYVWRVGDDFFLNAEIVGQGYGFAYTKYPFEYMEDFRSLERAAREEMHGLWADEERIGEAVD